MKKIRYFWKYIVSFSFSNFILSALIFGIAFYSGKQISEFLKLDENVVDQALYTMNFDDDNALSDQVETAYYHYVEQEIDGEYRAVLEINKAALKYGAPCQSERGIFFIAFDKTDLPEKTLLTNKEEWAGEAAQYANYLTPIRMKNFFIHIEFDVEYLYIDDEITNEGSRYAVYSSYDPLIDKTGVRDNEISDYEITISGKNLKGYHQFSISILMRIFVFIAAVPLIFSALAISNLYLYYLEKQKGIFEIQGIYYKPREKMIFQTAGELTLFSFLPSLAAIVLMFFLFSSGGGEILVLSVLITFLIEETTIVICTRKKIAKRKNKVKRRKKVC